MRFKKILAILLFTSAANAAPPVILSISPSSGPVTGGTTVQIHGTNFAEQCPVCSPPIGGSEVYFGNARAESRFINSTLLEAVTPPHVPGTVSVTVIADHSDATGPHVDVLEDAFTYEGDVYTAFDPLLFPIFTPPVRGQSGSEFRTTATLWNKNRTGTENEVQLHPECSDSVGRLFLIPKGNKSIAASLRVWETSKQAENHGVEIPVVRREEFSEDSIALLSVPVDPQFRLTLRIYGLNRQASFVTVSFGNRTMQVPLQPGRTLYEPSYAVVTDFTPSATAPPSGRSEDMTVLVEVPRNEHGSHIPGLPIWAFITVTNNVTQHITTITPQP